MKENISRIHIQAHLPRVFSEHYPLVMEQFAMEHLHCHAYWENSYVKLPEGNRNQRAGDVLVLRIDRSAPHIDGEIGKTSCQSSSARLLGGLGKMTILVGG